MARNNTAEGRENLFTKKQLMSSERFNGCRDILSVLLKDDKEYSVKAAEQMIEKYLKGKVK